MTKPYRVDFEMIKARADFRAVLAHYHLTPVGRGDQVKILCPFHDDDRPSCSVNLADGLFHCFGAGCNLEGNVLDFVHRMEVLGGEAVTIRQAAVTLAEICGLPVEATGARKGARKPKEGQRATDAPKGPPTSSKAPPGAPGGQGKAARDNGDPKVNRPLGFALTLDPAHPYLKERGLAPELVSTFGLGFCGKGSMAGRVCIPIGNVDGATVAYAGRWVGPMEDLPEGKDKYELPAGFHKSLELFNLHRVKHCRHLVVVEGFFGTIRLHGERIPAVGLMGGSISERQIVLLLEHCPNLRFVTVMLDGDEPGREAAQKVAARIAQNWWTRIVHLPDGVQPDTIDGAELERLLGRGQG